MSLSFSPSISAPCVTMCRIRRMVFPYEVVAHDAFNANNYPPEAHAGVDSVVTALGAAAQRAPPGSRTTSKTTTSKTTTPAAALLEDLLAEEHAIEVAHPASEGCVQTFHVGRAFDSSLPRDDADFASQQVVYDALGKSILDSLFDGFNTSFMCIGPRGSGKTYTLFGPRPPLSEDPRPATTIDRNSGLILRLCKDLFARIDERKGSNSFLVEVSAVEIRSEEVYDLLTPPAAGGASDTWTPCPLRHHPKVGTYAHGISHISCPDHCSLIETIEDARAVRAVMDAGRLTVASDSHVVYTVVLHGRDADSMDKEQNCNGDVGSSKSNTFDPTNTSDFTAKLTIVEIAGCIDRSASLLDARPDRLYGKCRLHKSLDALGKCVDVLAENAMLKSNKLRVVPHHLSTLTSLLKYAGGPLGGTCRSFVMACVAPTNISYADTVDTLTMLKRISRVRNKPSVQIDSRGRNSRGFRAHASILERELAELQSNAPAWADPELPIPETDENGVKITSTARSRFITERKVAWGSYRSQCELLANGLLETEALLSSALETWTSRYAQSDTRKTDLEMWLRSVGALHGRSSPSSAGVASTKSRSQLPRLVSLHPCDDISEAQCFFFDESERKLFGTSTIAGMEMRKSHCQIIRDQALASSAAAEVAAGATSGTSDYYSSKENHSDSKVVSETRLSDLVLSVSPRAQVHLNGKLVKAGANVPIVDGDCIVLGVGRMFRVDVPGAEGKHVDRARKESKGGAGVESTTKQPRRTWRDSTYTMWSQTLKEMLTVEETLIKKAREDAAQMKRRVEELQAQVAVEKRRLSKATSKRRRDAKKAAKNGTQELDVAPMKRQEDALRRRIDQLDQSIMLRIGESKAYDARVAQAERGSRVLQDHLLHDLSLVHQVRHMSGTLGSNISFTPLLVPNHAKVAKLALHDSSDSILHAQADVELWFEVSIEGASQDPSRIRALSSSPSRKQRGSPRQKRRTSKPAVEPTRMGPLKAMWNRDRFLLRSQLIGDMYRTFCAAGGDMDSVKGNAAVRRLYNAENDPFVLGSGSGAHQAIGQAHMYLDSLSYFIEFEEVVAIIDFRGKEVGKLRVQVTPLKLAGVNLLLDEVDERQTQSLRDFLGEEYEFVITIIGARDLPSELCSSVFVAMSLPDLEAGSPSAAINPSENGEEGYAVVASSRFFETMKHAHDTVHPYFNVPMKICMTVTEHMCEALSRDMVEFTIHGARPGSGFSIEQHEEPNFAARLKKADPLRHELVATKTELSLLSMSLSATKLGMEEARLEAQEKQVSEHVIYTFFRRNL